MEVLQRKLVRMRDELAQARALLRSLETDVDEVERALAEAASVQLAEASKAAPAMPAAQSGTDTAGAVHDARMRGENLLQQWVRDGTLIPRTELRSSWRVSRQALDQTVERGELFSPKIAGRRYYLAQLRDVTRVQASEVCRALGTLSPGERLTFCLRKHGGLQGRTAVAAIHEGQLGRVAQLARAWANERAGPSSEPGSDARP